MQALSRSAAPRAAARAARSRARLAPPAQQHQRRRLAGAAAGGPVAPDTPVEEAARGEEELDLSPEVLARLDAFREKRMAALRSQGAGWKDMTMEELEGILAEVKEVEAREKGGAEKGEGLGLGFWFVIAAIPTGYLLYTLSQPGADGSKPYLTRLIEKYSIDNEVWAKRNALHEAAIAKAADDRTLFLNSTPAKGRDLHFPETFNVGSPYNVRAGHSNINLDKVIAHYREKNDKEQAEKLQGLKDGTLKAQVRAKEDAEWRERTNFWNAFTK
ncbi:hypothetical protein BDY21DRAFT_336671 [Lineolata rhizophorae]|uniref:Uncharacterized protein n=1 Tax=Lineolata rhizophorae TaxID=578093 RepID=A0A6A6P793_9PEZI|nr:hypothetical protein BDY21DRAFT_336671 [Lineolata rhizophorae]